MGGLVSIVFYSRPSLMIIASQTQFHVERPWGQALVIIVPLQLARGQQDQCQWWRGGCQLAGAGDSVLHQEAGPTLQQCMSLCRAVAGCGYIAWSQHLLGDTTCRLLRLALVRINLCPGASKYWRFKSLILHFISQFTITHLHK